MKRSILAALSLTLFVGCGGGDTGDVSIALVRVGDAEFDANFNGTLFPVTLTEAKITFDAINLVENGEETEVLAAQTVYDYFANDQLDVGTITVVPTNFNEIHVIPGVGGDGLTLRLAFTVTVDGGQTQVEGQVNFALEAEEEQIVQAAVNVAAGDNLTATLAFDQETLLNGIDFDAVSAGADFVIEAGTGDANIDAALATIEANLFSSFAFVAAE